MQVAEMKDREPVERDRQLGRTNVVEPNLDVFGVLASTPVKSGHHQRRSNNRRAEKPVLRMKEIDSAAEDPGLALIFDSEPLSSVQSPEAPFQFFEHAPIDRKDRAMPR